MAKRAGLLQRSLTVAYLAIVLAAWVVAVWAFVRFVVSPGLESLHVDLPGDRRVEMLAPEWLGVGLVLPLFWLVRKLSLSDLPWLQQILNVSIRSLLVVALVLALSRIVITDFESPITTVFLVDVSESVPDGFLEQAQSTVQQVYDARGRNAVRLVTFARDPVEVPIAPGAAAVPPIRRHTGEGAGLESNLGRALRYAYGLFPQEHIKRAVILSDGNLNRGDVLSEVVDASRYGIRVSTVQLDYERPDEVLIRALDFPTGVMTNEPFHITVDVFSTYDGEIALDLTQNEFRDIIGRRFAVRAGEVVQLDLVAEVYEPGHREFQVEIHADPDHFADNNRFVHTMEVAGRPQVLYVEGSSRSQTYLSRALDDERNERVSFDLDVRTARGLPSDVDEMSRFDLVILSDVPANDLSRASMDAVRQYVRDEGGSFIMIGGENSFGPGGYQGTIMEEILPVTFEGRRLESMPSVALMLVIDRSGSMEGTKLEMAKDAARAAVELLGPQDRVGVIAFDTRPQTAVRLQSASNRIRIENDIGRITPGGGTDILPALEEAYLELAMTSARTKHVILLTDGDAPREGISDLVRDMRSERITISTVGVGADANRSLLEMIADISGGRSYHTNSASAIPQIFVQETSQVARTSLVEEPFRPRVTEPSAATRGIDFGSAPYLLGYVSTRAKRGATVGLETELGEPLYAYWRFGRGRTAVFTSDCKNRWMVEWIREPIYPQFWAQVVNHLMRRQASPEDSLDMNVSVRDGRGWIWVDAIGADDRFINGLISTVSIEGPGGWADEVVLDQVAAGRYEADFELPAYGSYVLEAEHELDGSTFAVSSASLANPYPDEYLAVEANYELLIQAVRLSGGQVDPSPAMIFDPMGERTATEEDLWPYFLFAALGLLILDILLRRIRLYGRTFLDWSRVTQRRGHTAEMRK